MRAACLPPIAAVGLVLGLWSCACDPPPTLAEAPELHGRRAIEARGDGRIPWFDAGRRPIVRVVGEHPWAVEWVGAEGITALPHRLDRRPDVSLLHITGGDPAPGPGAVQLRVGRHPVARWPAAWTADPDLIPPVAEARRLREAGDPAGARAVLDADDRPEVALWGAVERARLALAEGGPAAAEAAWLRAAERARASGLPSEESRRLGAAAFMARRRWALSSMATHLARAEALDGDDAAGVALTQHGVGVLALELADWRRAERAFDRAEQAATRAGLDDQRRRIAESRAVLLGELGLHREALALIEPLAARADLPAADRARLALNTGWLTLRAMAEGAMPRDLHQVRVRLAAADADALDAVGAASLLANRAWVEFDDGDPAAAARLLAEAEAKAGERSFVAPFLGLFGARLALAEGDAGRAEARFTAARALARAELGPDGGDIGWRAELGLGRVARAVGDTEAARRWFADARRHLERIGAATRVRQSRVPFYADRRALVEASIEVALDRDEPAEAFAIADRARGRVLRGMRVLALVDRLAGADRTRWIALQQALETARGRLAALRDEGEALAGQARAEWRGRLDAAERARVEAFDATVAFLDARIPTADADPDAARRALAPDQAILAVARLPGGRVALWAGSAGYAHTPLEPELPPGRLPDAPWPVGHVFVVASGHPDVVRAAVAAGVERGFGVSLLPVADALARPPARPVDPPMILADPTYELPEARRAGRALAATLPGARLREGEAATPAALREGLAGADLVHFSGHGVLRAERPWSAHLVLADGARFDVFDALSTPIRGAVVVLNGCETGVDRISTRDDVLGLPEALLVSGATAVVAADRTLPDADARRFTELFHAADGRRRPGPAMAAAMAALRDEGRSTWDAWRLVGRPRVPHSDPMRQTP